jgi:hypothetical protein
MYRKKRRGGVKRKRGFFSNLSRSVSGLGGKVAGYVGGKRLGRFVRKGTRKFHKALSYLPQFTIPRVLGSGGYKVKMNSIMSGQSNSNQVPLMHMSKAGKAMRLRHREKILDIVIPSAGNGSADKFSCRPAIRINPANDKCCPWGSRIAKNFEEWIPLGFLFEYKSFTGSSITTTTNQINIGNMMLATDYNSNNGIFTESVQMNNTEYTVSGKPTQNIIHGVECHPKQLVLPHLFTGTGNRSGAVSDLRFSNLGNFMIATEGFQIPTASYIVGEVWVSYDVLLMKPFNGVQNVPQFAHYQLGGATTSDYFKDAVKTDGDLEINLTTTKIKFPSGYKGKVLIGYQVYGASTACTTPTYTLSNGVSVSNVVFSDLDNGIDMTTVTTTNLLSWFFYSIDGSDNEELEQPTITFSGGVLPTTPSAGDLFIQCINDDFDN